ncbi:hypothetical protein ACIPPR_34070 [Streptomyces nigra]|uniref:hypothetical protein n=1 Tax=Streptomyces nigra TaxID=1827580 RepID=UPI003800B300
MNLEAAVELLRTAFPLLPGDGDGEPPVPTAAVAEQRGARHAERGQRLADEEERLYRLAHSLSGGYTCWVPDGPEELEALEKLVSWLHWITLRVDLLCGPTNAADQWASVFGTLESVTTAGLGFSPGGRHHTLHIPWHRIVALTGAPHWDRGHRTPDLWQPYKPLDTPPHHPPVPAPPPPGVPRCAPCQHQTAPHRPPPPPAGQVNGTPRTTQHRTRPPTRPGLPGDANAVESSRRPDGAAPGTWRAARYPVAYGAPWWAWAAVQMAVSAALNSWSMAGVRPRAWWPRRPAGRGSEARRRSPAATQKSRIQSLERDFANPHT